MFFLDYLKKKIQDYILKYTGTKLQLNGLIMANMYGEESLIAKNVSIIRDASISTSETLFALSVKELKVTISLSHYLSGKGLIESCSVQGVRGTIGNLSIFMYIP